MRIALYHNLAPGGALRAMAELTRRSSASHEYTLYESRETAELRSGSGMGLGLDGRCARLEVREMPSVPLEWMPVGEAAAPLRHLQHLQQLDSFEQLLAAEIERDRYDAVVVHPCRFRYTPAILRYLELPSLYFMQEPRRPSFEARVRARRLDARSEVSRVGRRVRRSAIQLVEARMRAADRATVAVYRGTVLCNSYHSAERILAAYGIEATVSYLGVDADLFAPDPSPTPRAEPPTVLSVGRVEPVKRYDLVVDALALVPQASRPRFTIVGCEGAGSAYEAELASRAHAADVDLVVVPDASEAELAARYRSALATVCTAELEPFGLTPLESIAAGTPVIAIRQGGYRESVIDGVNGLLVDASPEAVADGIQRVADSRAVFDPATLHGSIVDGAWTWDHATARYESHVRRVVAEESGGPTR